MAAPRRGGSRASSGGPRRGRGGGGVAGGGLRAQDGPPSKVPAVPVPPPRIPAGFGPNQVRLLRLPSGTLGATPVPSPETKAKEARLVEGFIDTEMTLRLITGQTRVM